MDLNKSKIRLKSQEEIDKKLQEFSGREHLYSIALFDILGFSNFVQRKMVQIQSWNCIRNYWI